MAGKLKIAVLCIGLLGLTLGFLACDTEDKPIYTIVSPASIAQGSPIPVPTEEVILTFYGDNLKVTNVGDTLQLDMPTLESLGLVEYSVDDPYRRTDVLYTGVLMSELGKYVGVTKPSDKFHIVALDDYQVELAYEDVQRWPILLATRSGGDYMSLENAGPTRIVFPYGLYPELDPVEYTDLWIWNIESMRID